MILFISKDSTCYRNTFEIKHEEATKIIAMFRDSQKARKRLTELIVQRGVLSVTSPCQAHRHWELRLRPSVMGQILILSFFTCSVVTEVKLQTVKCTNNTAL